MANGFRATKVYAIAAGLAGAITVVYGASGLNIASAIAPTGSDTVQLTSIGVGSTTNYAVATSVTFNSSAFLSASFTATASGMAGGLYSPTGTTAGSAQYVYSPSGAKIATLQNGHLVKGTVPLPGGGTAIYNAGGFGYFRHKDWLGSSLLATRWDHSVYSKEAYAPFGETENNMEAGTPDRSFTGQDQDTTNGVYDYLFRKYDPVAGRWMSPDPSGWSFANPYNPQSLNLYAYAMNNPLVNIDPTGLDCVSDNGDGTASINSGDCPGKNANSEYYYDCGSSGDGCLTGTTSGYMTAQGNLALWNGNTSGSVAGGQGSQFDNPWGDALFSPRYAGMIGNGGMQAIGVFTAGSVVLGTGGGLLLSGGVIGGAGLTSLGLEAPTGIANGYLWTGPGSEAIASSLGTTLNDTMYGQAALQATAGLGQTSGTYATWAASSTAYVGALSGTVNAIINLEQNNPNGIFFTQELPVVWSNPAITGINMWWH